MLVKKPLHNRHHPVFQLPVCDTPETRPVPVLTYTNRTHCRYTGVPTVAKHIILVSEEVKSISDDKVVPLLNSHSLMSFSSVLFFLKINVLPGKPVLQPMESYNYYTVSLPLRCVLLM